MKKTEYVRFGKTATGKVFAVFGWYNHPIPAYQIVGGMAEYTPIDSATMGMLIPTKWGERRPLLKALRRRYPWTDFIIRPL